MAYLLQQLLTESAARHPDHEAIRFESRGLTYRELDRVTNQLARTLRSAGVRRGDRVGIWLHKSFASVISVFGIMKAGGVYVPLDPSAPIRRQAYICRNCEVRLILTSPSILPTLSKICADDAPIQTVVVLDEKGSQAPVDMPEDVRLIPWAEVQGEDDTLPETEGLIDTDLAYILYTSGSTGDPKGVMVTHRTIFTFINWCHRTFGITKSDRITSHAPLHFDLSTFDIYVTIKAGGTVVVVPDNLSIFPSRLVELLQDEEITVTYLVPSVLTLMVNYGKLDKYRLDSLRLVLFAGEVFPIKYLRLLVEKVPHPSYFNLYGPTETNVCTYYQVKPSDLAPERTQPVPIGKACENLEVFAVNEDHELVRGPGQEGELWVRGSGVAAGYWGDPEKTADSFVPNPFKEHFHEMVYRTGDIVTLDDDGSNWIFLGRRDGMVKSRGYRIELGEIEAALYSHDQVKEAAAVAVPDEILGNRINAYIVPQSGGELTIQELESHCLRIIPRYMVPNKFDFWQRLPRTSNGKVDRAALMRLSRAHSGD